MHERGVSVDHTTVNRWVLKYSPHLEEAFHRRKRPVYLSWRLDETYIRVRGQWRYLYRTVDKHGHTIDFLLTPHRDQQAAQDFLTKATRRHSVPEKLTIDGSEANAAAIRSYRVPYHDLGPEHFDRLATERLTRHYVHRLEQLGHRVPLNTEVA
jgi:putative transposase